MKTDGLCLRRMILKVNFYVSFIDANSPIGMGLILHNSARNFMGAKWETSTTINEE